MFPTFALVMALVSPVNAATPVTHTSVEVATFIPVCRDGRGGWDRRACRHVRHSDPARLILAYLVSADAPSAIG